MGIRFLFATKENLFFQIIKINQRKTNIIEDNNKLIASLVEKEKFVPEAIENISKFEYNFEEKVLISSFNHKCINIFKELDNNLKYGALYDHEKDYSPEANVVEHAKKLGVYSINISRDLVTEEMVNLAHENGLKVFVYTVNTPIIMRKMINYNVDGVFSDYPELMNEIIKEY